MDNLGKESFSTVYTKLKRKSSDDPFELIEIKRKLLQLSCESVAHTPENAIVPQLFGNLYVKYSESTRHGALFDSKAKAFMPVNNSSKWKSSVRNDSVLKDLKNTQTDPKVMQQKFELLGKIVSVKSYYVPQVKPRQHKAAVENALAKNFAPRTCSRRVVNLPKITEENESAKNSEADSDGGRNEDKPGKYASYKNKTSNTYENKFRNYNKKYKKLQEENSEVPFHRRKNDASCEDNATTKANEPRKGSTPTEDMDCQPQKKYGVFRTARDELNMQNVKKYGGNANIQNAPKRRRLGLHGARSKFISPMLSNNESSGEDSLKSMECLDGVVDERLKNIDPKMVELIRSEIMDMGASVDWNDIAGLEFAKNAIQEAVVWPMLRPDIFTGLRRPPKGILLFGPPGTGKTLIGKCVASQSKSTFFSISASSLTSKWVGDGEKMVRALFAVARCHQPAVIFIDEIDSLLSQRSDTEHESSRRIKTEFLVQLDGATTDNEERLLLIGATNRPQELDEAARRRFVKRLYIPLPETVARSQLVGRLMSTERHSLTDDNLEDISRFSDGYSGADMRNLCADACMGPIRSIDISQIQNIQAQEVRPVSMEDFTKSLCRVRPSVSSKDLDQYIVWDKTYGSGMF